MKRTQSHLALLMGLFACALLAPYVPAQAAENAAEATHLGVAAYVYGYPLVTMEMTRRVMTNVSEAGGNHAPMGQFVRMREYPTAAYRDVTAPNADTLYTAYSTTLLPFARL